jgi:hypothetical protein
LIVILLFIMEVPIDQTGESVPPDKAVTGVPISAMLVVMFVPILTAAYPITPDMDWTFVALPT